MTSLMEVKRFICNADQSEVYEVRDAVRERQETLSNSQKFELYCVMHAGFADSYYPKDNKDGALDRLYAIVFSERYRKNPDDNVGIKTVIHSEEEIKVIKEDGHYFASGFPSVEELPFI